MKRVIVPAITSLLLLASCGQQTVPASNTGQSNNQQDTAHTRIELKLQPASTLPTFLEANPDIKSSLEAQGILDKVLAQASKGMLTPQQMTTAGDICTIDYGTDVIQGDYVGGQAEMTCSAPFGVGTSLEVITNRQPSFAQIEGINRYAFSQWQQTSMYVSTKGSFLNQRGQTYCTNSTAFIALLDGRYAASKQNSWDCMPGY